MGGHLGQGDRYIDETRNDYGMQRGHGWVRATSHLPANRFSGCQPAIANSVRWGPVRRNVAIVIAVNAYYVMVAKLE